MIKVFFNVKEQTFTAFSHFGYENNFLLSLGLIVFVIIGFIVSFFFVYTVYTLCRRTRCIRKGIEKLGEIIFYNSIIRAFLQGYITFELASLISLKNLNFSTNSSSFASILSVICVFLFTLAPFYLLRFMEVK
jgi:hypothetical protein